MKDYYQVFVTDQFGEVRGYTFDDPILALEKFSQENKRFCIIEVLFHKLGSQLITTATCDLNYAIYSESQLGNEVRFYQGTTLQEMQSQIEAYRIPKGYVGRYNSKAILFDIKEGKVIQELIQSE